MLFGIHLALMTCMKRVALVGLAALLGTIACSRAEEDAGAGESEVRASPLDNLTEFVIDTPEEKELYGLMRGEIERLHFSYEAMESMVPDLVKRASKEVRDIYPSKLSKPEVVALYFYTTAAYEWLNGPLRAKDPARLAKWENTIKVTSSAINKLPSFECTVRRGTGLPPDVLSHLVAGADFREPAFLSTTQGTRVPKQFVKAVEMKIHSNRCREISWASHYPNEKEVLFPPGSQFKVTKRVDGGTCKAGVREHCIDLDEVPARETVASVPTGTKETEPSNGAKGVDKAYRENDLRNKKFVSLVDDKKFIEFDSTTKGTWLNTNGTNKIVDWVLDREKDGSNIIEMDYEREDGRKETGYFLLLSETMLGRLYGPEGVQIAEYYEVKKKND